MKSVDFKEREALAKSLAKTFTFLTAEIIYLFIGSALV